MVCIVSSLLAVAKIWPLAHRASFSRCFKLQINEEEAASDAPADDMNLIMKSADRWVSIENTESDLRSQWKSC